MSQLALNIMAKSQSQYCDIVDVLLADSYHLHSDSLAAVVLFSVVSVCLFVSVSTITLESFEISQ